MPAIWLSFYQKSRLQCWNCINQKWKTILDFGQFEAVLLTLLTAFLRLQKWHNYWYYFPAVSEWFCLNLFFAKIGWLLLLLLFRKSSLYHVWMATKPWLIKLLYKVPGINFLFTEYRQAPSVSSSICEQAGGKNEQHKHPAVLVGFAVGQGAAICHLATGVDLGQHNKEINKIVRIWNKVSDSVNMKKAQLQQWTHILS